MLKITRLPVNAGYNTDYGEYKLCQSEETLENNGFLFTWGYDIHEVCVRYRDEWLGTFKSKKEFSIPHEARVHMADVYMELNNIAIDSDNVKFA